MKGKSHYIAYFLTIIGLLIFSVRLFWPVDPVITERKHSMAKIDLLNGLTLHETTLKNGLRLIVIPNHFAPVFTYRTFYHVGSKDEVTGKRGLAHLFEHMMFRETENLKNGDFDRLTKEWGGTGVNAYTSTDVTAYIQSLPTPFLEDIAGLEADRAENLVIDKDRLNEERGAVLGEYHMNLNNPGRVFFYTLNKLIYDKHPYRYEVIGTEEEIKNFSVEDCLSFYKAFYAPNNASVVVIGDVNPEGVLKIIENKYGHISSSQAKRADMPVEPVQTEKKVKTITHPYASQVEMGVGLKVLNIDESMLPYYMVLEMLLSSDPYSLAYQALVQNGLATSVGAHFDLNPQGQPSTFYFMATVAPNTTQDAIQKATEDFLVELSQKKISSDMLEMAVNQVKRHYYVESNESLAGFVGVGLQYNGDPAFVFKFFFETFLKTKFQPEKMLALTQSLFSAEKMNFLFLAPKAKSPKGAQGK